MKKTAIAVILAAVLGITATAVIKKKNNSTPHNIRAGSSYTDFVLGMKDSNVYRLKDVIGSSFIILSFTDPSNQSAKFMKIVNSGITEIINSDPSILWFNISEEGRYAVVEELTGRLNIKYRTLQKNIPKDYNYPEKPSLLVIDNYGTVRLVYIGYSPTLMRDILNGIGAGAE